MDTRPKKMTDGRPCPFCEGKESETPPEVYALRPSGAADGPGWKVRAVPSKLPILSGDGTDTASHGEGIYDWREGMGRHEIVVETPRHGEDLDALPVESLADVLRVYLKRMRELEKDPRFAYGLLFKNHGLVSGAASDVIRHSRSQIIGFPIVPKRAKEELSSARVYYERRERCVFCDVLKQEALDGARTVVQNDAFFAFCPFASRSPFEMWILPKKHSSDFTRTEEAAVPPLAVVLKSCLSRLGSLLDDPPYNMILHTAPFRHAGQETHWKTLERDTHWYLQIMPRLTQNAGFEWGTGIHINPTPPEDAAALLREAEAT